MKIVIQCAATKVENAGHMINYDGKKVVFVAHQDSAPIAEGYFYTQPDYNADQGRTWRQLLEDYNQRNQNNLLGLVPAYKLYKHPVYEQLVEKYGLENVFILSAGWGLIRADFLTPYYDITFSAQADTYKRRREKDPFFDLSMLPASSTEDMVFFGGKSYLKLFCSLTQRYKGTRFIFYNLTEEPQVNGCKLIKYETKAKTNWHYGCAKDFAAGRLGL